jgi:hypothetical protein
LIFGHHFTEVDKSVTHTAQRRVDAAIGNFSNFFKAKVGVMSENNDFS